MEKDRLVWRRHAGGSRCGGIELVSSLCLLGAQPWFIANDVDNDGRWRMLDMNSWVAVGNGRRTRTDRIVEK